MASKSKNVRRERRVSLTLSVGECEVLRSSIIFGLVGERYSDAVRFFLRKGLEETLARRIEEKKLNG